jgi:ABC-2 type transport system permease protein
MSRLFKIARREYLAYVRTLGFWLSMWLMPLGILLAIGAPALVARSSPPPRLVVIDLTGRDYASAIDAAVKLPRPGRTRAAPPQAAAQIVTIPIARPHDAQEAGRLLRPWFERRDSQRIDDAAVIRLDQGSPAADVWSRNLVDQSLQGLIRDAIAERMRQERLASLGVPRAALAAADALAPRVTSYSPSAQGREAALRDRLPGLIGFGLGMLLWAMIFTGAGILLNSVIEEKSSRVLEVLLASASIPEIMGGKILGVAGVTATVLGMWASIGLVVLLSTAPQFAGDLGAVLIGRGLIFYFAVYLVGGYVIYACLFTAIGAHCETTREAQTLLAPLMMVSTIPVVFLGQAITRPDAPAIALLSWIPPFTPFLAPARAAADPPLWQMLASVALTAVTAIASGWISVRAFRAGALSGGRTDARPLILRLLRPSEG